MKEFFKKTFSANLNRNMVMTVLGTMIVLSLGSVVFQLAGSPVNRGIILVLIGLLVIALFFAYRGTLFIGQIAVPVTLFALIVTFVYQGGIRNPISFGFSAAILVAGLFLGEGGGTLFGVFSAIAVLIIGLSEANGSLNTYLAQFTTLTDGIILAVLILGSTFIQRALVRRLNEAVRTAQQKVHTQVATNEELRALQSELEARVAQRTTQLKATHEVTRVANSILDPDELISKVVNLITDSLGYYYAAIFLVADNGRWAELRDATGKAGQVQKSQRYRLQIGENDPVTASITSKEPQIALDIGETPVHFNNPLLPNTRSEIALPLLVGDTIIGAVDVHSAREGDFNPDDISTLQSMANQVAIAIQNARLFQQMNDSLEELRLANRQYITTSWQDKLKSTTLEYSAIQATREPGEVEPQQVQIDLNLRDQKIGKISIETSDEWSEDDQAWVEALATQVAISLENARLIEESQQSALRERLSSSIIQKLWSASSVDNILETAVRELGHALDVSEAGIELKLEDE